MLVSQKLFINITKHPTQPHPILNRWVALLTNFNIRLVVTLVQVCAYRMTGRDCDTVYGTILEVFNLDYMLNLVVTFADAPKDPSAEWEGDEE